MNATARPLLMQRWHVVQQALIPHLQSELGTLTPKLERLIHTLAWARTETFCPSDYVGTGRRPHERVWLANAFLAKAVLGIRQTRA
jgi:hypothetical protein